jgi:hypothetical protein
MKTAVSIPDPVFSEAERLAKTLKKSRSQLYAEALEEYAARHDPDEVTAAWDAVCADVDSAPDAFLREAARRALRRSRW